MDANRVCTSCNSLTVLFTNPSGSSLVCAFSASNCNSYNNYGYCEICNEGYVQMQRVCLSVAANCDSFVSGDNSKCTFCSKGYHVFNSNCYADVEGCLSYSFQSLCLNCNKNYLLKNSNCYFNDANCVAQDSKGNCLTCINGFLPFKNRCVIYDPFCLNYGSDGVCVSPSNQFTLSGLTISQKINYWSFVKQFQSNSGLSSSLEGGQQSSNSQGG